MLPAENNLDNGSRWVNQLRDSQLEKIQDFQGGSQPSARPDQAANASVASRGFRRAGCASGGGGEGLRLQLLQQPDDFLPKYGAEAFQEILDGIARFQMIEEALGRNARAAKHWHATLNLRVDFQKPAQAFRARGGSEVVAPGTSTARLNARREPGATGTRKRR